MLVETGRESSIGKDYVLYSCSVCGYNGRMRADHWKNNCACSVCSGKTVLVGHNDVATKRPDLVELFKDKDVAKSLTVKSGKKVDLICSMCGYETSRVMADLSKRGFKCPFCYGGYSYPARVVSAFLDEFDVSYKREAKFTWSDNYKYDFYVKSINAIIEVNGGEHYGNGFKGMFDVDSIRKTDLIKKTKALHNGIASYFVIEAIKTDFESICDSIMRSGLVDLLNFTFSADSLIRIYNDSQISLGEKILHEWNAGVKDLQIIADKLNLCKPTITKYLGKYGEKGACDYDAQEMKKHGNIIASKLRQKKTVCINTGEIFNSAKEAAQKYNIKPNALYECLSGRNKSAGLDVDGNKLIWKYL